MPTYEVTSPDGKVFEVTAPEGASQSQILAFAQQQLKVRTHTPVKATDDMSGPDKFWAAMGKAPSDLWDGVKQRLGKVSEQEVAETRARDKPLMDSGAGMAGNLVGNVATLLPALAVPGANTVAGAAVVGGLSGAAQPTTEGESALANTAGGAALGGASQWGIGKLAGHFGQRLQAIKDEALAKMAKNSVRDTSIREGLDSGYKTLPSIAGGSMTGRVVEGLTGIEKAKQLASSKNQPVTDALVRKAFGLIDDEPLSHETMRQVRGEAIQAGYDPLRQIPVVRTDNAYRVAISGLTSRADNAAKDFGTLVQSDVAPIAKELHAIKGFSGDSAVDAISIFREKASNEYAQGNKTLGAAYRKAAEAIEDQIERSLTARGKNGADMLQQYRAARTKVAQTFDAEKALREGQGVIDARVIGKLFEKAPERLSGEFATIGRTAAAMPDVMSVPKAGWENPVTALDSWGGGIGSILAGNPAPLAIPAVRAAARYGMFTKPGQSALAMPHYGPNALQAAPAKLLEALRFRAAGGAVPSMYPGEE